MFGIIIGCDRALGGNQLSGTIPSFLGDLSSLTVLYVSDRNACPISPLSLINYLLFHSYYYWM